eukprot:2261971-Prymnesium_polylepis.1
MTVALANGHALRIFMKKTNTALRRFKNCCGLFSVPLSPASAEVGADDGAEADAEAGLSCGCPRLERERTETLDSDLTCEAFEQARVIPVSRSSMLLVDTADG